MKKKILIVLTIILFVVIFSFSSVYATETITENVIESDAATEAEPVVEATDGIPEDIEREVVEQLYFNSKEISEENYYRAAEDITLSGKIINGNVFIAASNVILKDITINGDVFILANKLNIEKEASLNGNVFIVSSNVDFNGKVARELYAVGKDIVFGEDYTIMYNANVSAEHISLNGTFYRDVNAAVTKFEINDGAIIFGTLNYSSGREAIISENANIANTNFELQIEEKETVMDIVVDKVLDFTRYFVLTMLVFIIVMKLLPNTIEKSIQNLSVSSFGIGIATLILVPILLVAFMFLRIFTTAVFAALALFVFVLIISMAITTIAVAGKISDKKPNFKLPIAVPVVTIITWIVYQIAFAGAVVAFIWTMTGLGIIVKNCFTKMKK